jgi:hypothetical protein
MALIFTTFPSPAERLIDPDLPGPISLINVAFLAVAGLVGALGWRVLAVAWGIQRLGTLFDVRVDAFHPDRSGGLKPLGDVCLLNALIIAVPGVYVGLRVLADPQARDSAVLVAVFLPAVIVLATIVFFLPLYAVHRTMRREVAALRDPLAREASDLAAELLQSWHRLTPEEFEERSKRHARLLQIYEGSRRMPTWPFPRAHLYAFSSSQVVQIVGLVATIAKLQSAMVS